MSSVGVHIHIGDVLAIAKNSSPVQVVESMSLLAGGSTAEISGLRLARTFPTVK